MGEAPRARSRFPFSATRARSGTGAVSLRAGRRDSDRLTRASPAAHKAKLCTPIRGPDFSTNPDVYSAFSPTTEQESRTARVCHRVRIYRGHLFRPRTRFARDRPKFPAGRLPPAPPCETRSRTYGAGTRRFCQPRARRFRLPLPGKNAERFAGTHAAANRGVFLSGRPGDSGRPALGA